MKKTLLVLFTIVLTVALYGHDNARGKVSHTYGDKTVTVEYGRPDFKDRDVNEVPDGTIWPIGADKATTLQSSGSLSFGDQAVAAGTYVLLAQKMGADEWELIVSGDAAARARGRDESLDAARVPLAHKKLDEPVKLLTVAFAEEGGLKISWGHSELSAAFSAD